MDLGAATSAIAAMEGVALARARSSCSARDADNILDAADEEQKQRYLIPTIEGERISCFATTEPGAGLGRPQHPRPSARKDGGDYVINGEKTFDRPGATNADFVMVSRSCPATDHLLPGGPGHGCEVRADPDDGSGPASLVLRGRPVPAASVLGIGKGFELAMQ